MSTRRGFLQAASLAAMASDLRAESNPALVKATEAVLAAVPLAEKDPERPIYHFHPPANWTNDPNGTLFYKGWHHLFYQLNPFGATIGNQHWGHARSRDLVNWEHLPIAIWPSEDKRERAIFSGGAVIARDGRPRVFYTSIGHPQPEQWMASPKDDDLLAWDKFSGNPVLSTTAHGSLNVEQWRDPFLFREAGQTYMVCGGNAKTGRGGFGQVQLYRAENDELTRWKHLGPVFQAQDRETYNIECPNLFKLDGKWVLIFSPHRPCEYYVGDLDLQRVKFIPETRGVLDAGDAYASNISVDDRGRTILWLWGRTNTPRGRGWNSVMVMPRLLSVGSDGFLRQLPAPEFQQLRGAPKSFPSGVLSEKPLILEGVPGDAAELQAVFALSGRVGSFGIEVRRSSAAKAGAVIAIERGMLTLGNVRSYVGTADRYKITLFIDKRSLEVYVNDGAVAVYDWVDATPQDQGIALFANAGTLPIGMSAGANRPAPTVTLESLHVWPMKPATFNMDRFRA